MSIKFPKKTACFFVFFLLTVLLSLGCTKRDAGQNYNNSDPSLEVLPGFEVQKIYEVSRNKQGSWVAVTVGPDGDLITSDEQDKGLFRIKISGDINQPEVDTEKLNIPISGAQGLAWSNEYLYLNVNGKGLFRISYNQNSDQFGVLEYLGGPAFESEHGNHAVVKSHTNDLFIVNGSYTPPPELTASRTKNWDEDILLPRSQDVLGHAKGITAPGGYIARVNHDATVWEMISIGYRNVYDIAVNQNGDLFAYDSDMEWDMGMPWYRPTRLVHAVSGSDFGWRSGSGKWKEYYEDSLPPLINMGPGSPTGLLFGTNAKFPAKYQRALYGLDWTFGTIYAFHMEPDGASYSAHTEEFLSGSPLPLTDAVIGNDGHFYFLTGGREKQSSLYRIVYKGNESTTNAGPMRKSPKAKQAHELRQQLEDFHGIQDSEAIQKAWPHLDSNDRFIRHAARVAIEWQPVSKWAEKALIESRPQARISALTALARTGNEMYRYRATDSLLELNFNSLNTMQKLGFLRAASLIFLRLGDPSKKQRSALSEILLNHLPHKDERVNTELIRILVYLKEPRVIEKALELLVEEKAPPVPDWDPTLISRSEEYGGTIMAMLNNPPPVHKLEYAFMLRNLSQGWNIKQRRAYFSFINDVSTKGMGGKSFSGFLRAMRNDALRNSTEEEREAVSDLTDVNLSREPDFEINPPIGPGRNWTVKEAMEMLYGGNSQSEKKIMGKLNFKRGRSLFHSTTCASCHRLGGYGGNSGPDLSSVANRYTVEEILEEIIHPSRFVSDQYSHFFVETVDGDSYVGQIVKKQDVMEVYTQNIELPPAMVPIKEVSSVEKIETSQMPPGLINPLNPDELKDLIAYLLAGGNPDDEIYQNQNNQTTTLIE